MPHRQVLGSRPAILLAIAALIGLAVALAGCGGGGEEPASSATDSVAAPGAEGEPAGGRSGPGAAAGPGGMRGGRGPRGGPGGRMGFAGGAAAPAEGEAEAAAALPAGIPPEEELSEVEQAEKLRDFAAVYGPTTRTEEKDWNGNSLRWVSFTYDGERRTIDGKTIKLPLRMVLNSPYPELLEGWFPIYTAGGRPSGELISRETITAPSRPKMTLEEIQQAKKEAAGAAAAQEGAEGEAAEAGTPAAETAPAAAPGPARGGRRGGPRGF